MRILQVASGDFTSTYGGGQVYVKNIVNCMLEMGLNVSVLSFVETFSNRKTPHGNGTLYEVPNNIEEEQLSKIAKKINPDIIHAHSNKALICRIGKKLNIPVVVTSHHGGILCPGGAMMDSTDSICHCKLNHKDCLPCVLRNTRTGLRWWYPFMKYLPENKYVSLGRFLSKKTFIPFITPIGLGGLQIKSKIDYWKEVTEKCSTMIAPCNAIAEAMIDNGLDRHKTIVLPHGIPFPKKRSKFPEIEDGKIKFFYVGRICYIKGIHVLLEAFHLIDNPHIKLHLIGGAVGNGETRYMNSLQKKYARDKRIIWHGKIDSSKMFDTISQFHVGCAPTICLEIFGLNIAEALAMGKPVLASRCGGAEMQIKDEVNGWLIDPNNVEELRSALQNIIENPSVLSDMSAKCSAISIEDHCNSLLKIYNRLLL